MKHNGGHGDNGERRPEEIQAEIARTRAEMDGTLYAIEQRLTPGQLMDQGIDYLRHSGANEFVSNLGGAVKQNPVPVALMGIGLAWMMALGRQPAQHESSWSSSRLAERARGAVDSLRGSAQGMQSSTQSTMESVRDSAQSMKDRMSGTAQSAMESMSSTAEAARRRASDLGHAAGDQMQRARSQLDYMIQEHPLVIGAIGLAVGALLGAAAPRTRQEDELMGGARDRMMDRAAEAGKSQMEKVEQAASAAKDAATQAVKKEAGKDSGKERRGDGLKASPSEPVKQPPPGSQKSGGPDGTRGVS
jgi:ElaB/YqjD/DUF883 family membrane-anchored ribosome-binding protein